MATVKKPNINDYTGKGYNSQYKDQISSALDKVTNRQEFTYDPLKDASYQALSKIYTKRGEQARQNTLGDAAAMTGGYASSYATSAAAQAQSDYNQQLAAQIPALQEAAYNRHLNDFNMNLNALNALQQADDSAYGKYRDTVADNQWMYGNLYDDYRNNVADTQWKTEFDRNKYENDRAYKRDVYESNRDYKYQKGRDKVSDKQWAKEYALKKNSLGGSLGRSKGSGSKSGSSYNYKGSGGSSGKVISKNPLTAKAKKNVQKKKNNNLFLQMATIANNVGKKAKTKKKKK